jgi:hypothetical protein
MNINGVWASLNFPVAHHRFLSHITGFCGRVYSGCSDPELGCAVTHAWNDWLYEEWYLAYPERIIPNALTIIADAELAAKEIRRNADRGFKAVTMPERPHRIGLPSIFDDYWEPVMRACVGTDTVVCLHVGSTGMLDLFGRLSPGRAGRIDVLGDVALGVPGMAVVPLPEALSRAEDRHVGRRHRVDVDVDRAPPQDEPQGLVRVGPGGGLVEPSGRRPAQPVLVLHDR